MAKARIELYKDGDHMAIVTNAEDEHDFWESFCELLAQLVEEDIEGRTVVTGDGGGIMAPHYGGDWEFQLRYWLPQATEIVCKLRGYKSANVHEERLIVSGAAHPTRKVHEIGPGGDLELPPPPVGEEAVAA